MRDGRKLKIKLQRFNSTNISSSAKEGVDHCPGGFKGWDSGATWEVGELGCVV